MTALIINLNYEAVKLKHDNVLKHDNSKMTALTSKLNIMKL